MYYCGQVEAIVLMHWPSRQKLHLWQAPIGNISNLALIEALHRLSSTDTISPQHVV